jgi:lysine 6-dehydrogenase
MVARELSLDAEAKAAGVCVVPDCGLAPGKASMLVAEGIRRLGRAESVRIRVGGLPQRPRPPLGYQLTFAVRGLINEYVEPARLLEDGRIVMAPSLTGLEALSFDQPPDLRAPISHLEAFHTSGGSSTLPDTYKDRVRNLDYKTIRYTGHCARMKMLMDLGLFSSEPVEAWPAGGAREPISVAPRDVVEAALVRALPRNEPDVVLVRVAFFADAASERDGRAALTFEMIDRFDEATGFTAMMRATGFPAAVAIWLAARGEVTARGALPQERCLEPSRFLEEILRRGLPIVERTAAQEDGGAPDSGTRTDRTAAR